MLDNKTIYIISPNRWGQMHISKHHYALELSKKKNIIYFINPPDNKADFFEKVTINENLNIINYKPIYKGRKYLPAFLFNFLVYLQVRFLTKKIGKKPDIVWSFSFEIFNNLKYFGAKTRIYHPVDQVLSLREQETGKSAQIIFSVADIILEKFNQYNTPKHFINHGLNSHFANYARTAVNNLIKSGEKIKAGFVGNMLKEFIDREIIKKIIISHPEIEFHFFGSFDRKNSNLGGNFNKNSAEFVEFLKGSNNVLLRGVFHPKELVYEMAQMDMFFLCINNREDPNEGQNAHKIIEYLSLGKVIVSGYLKMFSEISDLINMPDTNDNQKVPEIFSKTVLNLAEFNREDKMKARVSFALDNTYEKQISRIEGILIKHHLI